MSFLLLVSVVAAVISLLVSHVLTTRRLSVIHDLVNSNLVKQLDTSLRHYEIGLDSRCSTSSIRLGKC